MLNILMIAFWSLTYIGIVVCSVVYGKEKKIYMPFFAGILNLSWEINAVIASAGYFGHIVWVLPDIFIFIYNVWILTDIKKRVIYIFFTVLSVFALVYVFSLESVQGMLISSFVIDVIMAAEFVIMFGKLSPYGKLILGILRFTGDLFAWIDNVKYSDFVIYAGGVVFVLNAVYLVLCICELKKKGIKHRKKKTIQERSLI